MPPSRKSKRYVSSWADRLVPVFLILLALALLAVLVIVGLALASGA